MGLSTTKPESQKTGMETTQPIIAIESTGCLLPKSFIMQSAILSAAPLCSKMVPISVPKIMTRPMPAKILEKPLPMRVVICGRGIPDTIPKMSAVRSIAIKGCRCHLEMATTIMAIAAAKMIISAIPLIVL